MNQLIKQVQRQTAFSHFPRLTGRQAYPIFHLPFFILLITLSFFLITACPGPPETPECGPHQIEINGDCDCEDGYHWNKEETKCLMDTTSHNVVWEIDTLGEYGSYLSDVAIIDENNVWVVGKIEADSGSYNAAHWDGSEWMFIKIQPQGYVQPINVIWFIADNDIWFGQSTLPIHWDGETYYLFTPADNDYPGGSIINSIWGTSPYNIYFVGSSGGIVHYDGNSFTRLESGTDESIIDFWGLDENHIWAVTHKNDGSGIINEVLFYDGDVWSIIHEKTNDNWPPTDYTKPSGTFNSVWAHEDTVYISCAGLYKESIHTGEGVLVPLEDMHWELGWGTGNVRGTNYNDIVITTSFGSEVSHFNGRNWKFYDELNAFDINDFIATAGLAIKNDMIVIVGEDLTTSKAMVYRGYR